MKAQNGAMKGRGRPQRRLETRNGAVQVCMLVVADLHHFDEEQDPELEAH
jgi:hypothetical protein